MPMQSWLLVTMGNLGYTVVSYKKVVLDLTHYIILTAETSAIRLD